MTYREAVRNFKIYNAKLYNDCVDYWIGQLCWSSYTDMLCKDGIITQKQYNTWSTPFPYGKRLKPSKLTLQTEVYK